MQTVTAKAPAQQPAISALCAAIPALPGKDQQFAASLIAQATNKPLSDKQLYWVNKLAAPAAPQAEAVKVGQTFAGVIALFLTAKEHLKFPAIRLALPSGQPIRLKLAGKASKNAGCVYVTADDTYLGRITPDGQFFPTGAAAPFKAELLTILAMLAADPAGTAAAYGKLTGACCFCSQKLTDERSTSVGYGPICAEHFGLPWGE